MAAQRDVQVLVEWFEWHNLSVLTLRGIWTSSLGSNQESLDSGDKSTRRRVSYDMDLSHKGMSVQGGCEG